MREQQALMSFLNDQQKKGVGLIVVTLFHTEGSTYQKPGTRLLVSPEGEYCGLISGGCLEPEIINRAQAAWQKKATTSWQVDTRDESDAWLGYGLGCKGLLWLIFEPLLFSNVEQINHLKSIISQASDIQRVIHAYSIKSQNLARAIQTKSGWQFEAHYPNYQNNDPTQVTDDSLILEEITPKPWALTLFTGGKDAEPLAALCNTLRWPYHIITRHPQQVSHNWPGASSTSLLDRTAPTKTLSKNKENYVIVMTHNFELDCTVLEALAHHTHIKYIGLLGPKHRKDSLLAEINKRAPAAIKILTPKLFAPIGLPLGGRTPTDIALSIISEIQSVRQNKTFSRRKHQKVSVVILAAGASKRLGFPKQLIEFRGKTLLQNAIEKARQVTNHGIYIVLGAHFEKISATLLGVEIETETETILYNPHWKTGLASTIKTGFQAAIPNPSESPEHSVLFMLVDQPLVTEMHLKAIVQHGQQQQSNIVASQYRDVETYGVPALFASNQASAITTLTGNTGCKGIINNTDSSAVLADALDFDIDYPDDVLKLSQFNDAETQC